MVSSSVRLTLPKAFQATFSPERLRSLPDYDWKLVKKIVNSCFSQRRKTLLNGLASVGFGKEKKELAAIIEEAGISPTVRAEKLSFEEFVKLTNVLEKALQK